MEYYADAEGGDYIDNPNRGDLIDLIEALDTTGNTFFVVYPVDDDLEWSIAVSKNVSAFGGFEIDRVDPATGGRTITTAADKHAIADDILAWVSQR